MQSEESLAQLAYPRAWGEDERAGAVLASVCTEECIDALLREEKGRERRHVGMPGMS